jgi:hypothetical protein
LSQNGSAADHPSAFSARIGKGIAFSFRCVELKLSRDDGGDKPMADTQKNVEDAFESGIDKVKGAAREAGEKAKEAARIAGDKAKTAAHNVGEKVKSVAHNVGEKGKEMAHEAGEKIEETGRKIKDANK